MKKLQTLFVICMTLFAFHLQAQEQYTVNGKTYILKTEVAGPLTLLWNTIDGEYRYFSQKDGTIEELKNTKPNGHYQEEYKQVLALQTEDADIPVKNVDLTLPGLHHFFVAYNKTKDSNYVDDTNKSGLQFRLGAFVGVTNSVYTENTFNIAQGVGGVDLEMIDAVKLKRHALVLRFKHTFESSAYPYSASQFSLNYRFKFVKSAKFDAFVNCKFAALTFSNREVTNSNPEEPVPLYFTKDNISGSDFNSPLTFGIGADYKVGNGFITFNYNDIVGLNLHSNGEFPTDFTVGYKFNL